MQIILINCLLSIKCLLLINSDFSCYDEELRQHEQILYITSQVQLKSSKTTVTREEPQNLKKEVHFALTNEIASRACSPQGASSLPLHVIEAP